jgi:hypothetical protein
MLIHCGNSKNLFRIAGIGLLAGCAWVASASIALAQDQNQNPAPQAQRNDATIQSDVLAAIAQDASLRGAQIKATAANGVITLDGTVQTDAERQQAETDAANVSGVSGIMNNLKVTNPGTASPDAGVTAQDSANQLSPQSENQNQNQAQEQNQNPSQTQNAVPPPPPDQPEQAPPTYSTQQAPAQRPPYQPNYPQQPYQQSYAPPVPYYATPSAPVTVPAGTLLRVRLNQPLDTQNVKSGTFFQATAAVDVYENGVLAIPRGALLTGQVVESKKPGDLGGSAVLTLQLTNVDLAGKIFPMSTDVWSSKGPNKAGSTVGNTAGGALVGALIGGIIGRGAGAALGAGIGATGGLAASAAMKGPRIYLPTETMIDFHLTNPATVLPVSWQEAQRLASSVPPVSQPVLVQRPRPIYVVPGPYYYPYPYSYPYPY